jgi:hypothetical protein
MPDLKCRLTGLETAVKTAAQGLSTELDTRLTNEINAIQASPEWGRLGLEDQTQFSNRLDKLRITCPADLAGLKKLLNHQYVLTRELEQIKAAIKECAKPKPPADNGKLEECYEVTLTLPAELTSVEQAEALIAEIEKLKPKFQQYVKIRITWKG